MRRYIDLTGQRFGQLIAISFDRSEKGRIYWNCRCDCGTEKSIPSHSLRIGHSKTCGCLKIARCIGVMAQVKIKHGHTIGHQKSRTYQAWIAMRRRCNNPAHPAFFWYGARGIKVCAAWENDFAQFLKDMGPCPPRKMLDRINPNGHYAPQNCRWASRTDQSLNKRNTIRVTIAGQTLPLKEWSNQTGIPYRKLYNRLFELHWSADKLLS